MDSRIVVVKAGDTFGDLKDGFGDFEDLIIQGLEAGDCTLVNAEKGEGLPDPGTIAGAVISGSHAMVTQDLDWSLSLEAWTGKLVRAGIPVLGICYGHQILARALGGRVDYHPGGLEIGTRMIRCLPASCHDPLFKGLPGQFKVHLYHSQSVVQLPPSAVLLAQNEFDPHQAFRVGAHAWGVQFHPEALAGVTRGYIRHLADAIKGQGRDPDQLLTKVEETPHGADVLRRFGAYVASLSVRGAGN